MFREYHYVNSPKTWAEAQKFCREVYTDLAAADSEEENQRLRLATQGLGKFAWIGLYDDPRRWTWTVGDADFNSDEEFNNWRFDQPDIKNLSESCVVITHIGVWRDEICETERPAVCFDEQRSSKYILVETLQTWHDAKNYCRSKNTDLAKVRNTLENDEVYKMLEKASWIGLHRKLWSKWSDQSPATFTNWNKGQPDNTGSSKTSCAAVNTTTGMWWNVACDTEQEFICEKLILSKRRFKLRLQSETDLNDPTAQQQILEQLHKKLKTDGLTDFKLRWVEREGQTFHKEPRKTEGMGT
ncbi:macrophage mannose receptor 1-like [Kryptolebias marmoratus]|uniref:macrophage mannose receptor 1-like n=1 Tax=Kryptolebias marmoratus TaxID=37003 RepID=UPI0018ACF62A|nr:macrophage mannose receptor 1-like [Kryptolebias marmoratus]